MTEVKEVIQPSITNFAEARLALSRFYGPATNYSLDSIRAFMEFLGNPQNQLKVIHVAGTSGKTSTCYYIAGLLKAAGKTVGLTVSPHVDEINERVQINLVPLPEAIFCEALAEFLVLVEKSELSLSYFEVMVAFAYWYFAKTNVDYAVIEVGLGGRLDGTNVVNREDKICVITSIGLDHTKILGETLPEIAAEKAGIIGMNNDVFTHHQSSEIMAVFESVSREKHAPLHIYEAAQTNAWDELPLFQQYNFGLARNVVDFALRRAHETVLPTAVTQALKTYVPARMEVLTYKGRTIIIDGAHNGQKMQALMASIAKQYPAATIATLAAFVAGDEKRTIEAVDNLLPHISRLIVTEFAGAQDAPKKSVTATSIEQQVRQKGFTAVISIADTTAAFAKLLECSEDILLVTGSFYLLNHIRPHIMKA